MRHTVSDGERYKAVIGIGVFVREFVRDSGHVHVSLQREAPVTRGTEAISAQVRPGYGVAVAVWAVIINQLSCAFCHSPSPPFISYSHHLPGHSETHLFVFGPFAGQTFPHLAGRLRVDNGDILCYNDRVGQDMNSLCILSPVGTAILTGIFILPRSDSCVNTLFENNTSFCLNKNPRVVSNSIKGLAGDPVEKYEHLFV